MLQGRECFFGVYVVRRIFKEYMFTSLPVSELQFINFNKTTDLAEHKAVIQKTILMSCTKVATIKVVSLHLSQIHYISPEHKHLHMMFQQPVEGAVNKYSETLVLGYTSKGTTSN